MGIAAVFAPVALLVLSDIHANEPALSAVLDAESWDGLLFLGDAVDCGPHPAEVLDILARLDGICLCGNHDRYVLDADPESPASTPQESWRQWTRRQLSSSHVRTLTSFDTTRSLTSEGCVLRIHHGNFAPPAAHDESWQSRLHPDREDAVFAAIAERFPEPYVVHGHSHIPFVKTIRGKTFVNPGSVGLQREGWPQAVARYAVLESGTFSLRSVPYDPASVRDGLGTLPLSETFLVNWIERFED